MTPERCVLVMLMNCRVSYIVINNVFLTENLCEVEYNKKKCAVM